ncbi:hypothetical protein KRR39_20370 [Nocardioides panacis]|uniref:PD-(D/E)XK nuclease superfamily protein n=1 Tax=Nocardioides panacis TaxID=2849501 RepID=A0A975SXE7_9ACTN|nr:hypothetical protein [Nocardioides panacis]QWZ07720.1 hypothetical protein KRR39_20370 [Nocardioides panacis]
MRYQHEITSVLDLIGRDEVDLTASLGWTLSVSPALRRALWSRLGLPGDPTQVEVALETPDDLGRTDLELRLTSDTGTEVLLIVEAKKGWLQPGEAQLTRYVGRFAGVTVPLLVSLSDSSLAWAARELPIDVDGVPVRHLPWDQVRTDLGSALADTRNGAERVWLTQLQTYLKGATAVRAYNDQWVYVVSVSKDRFGDRTFRDYVTTERAYFHPFGKNWPRRPPVLMGFRWDGKLQQVNRVVSSTVLPSLGDRWPDIPGGPEAPTRPDGVPHVVYDLGPDIPVPAIPTGKIYRARRIWALLDQLLTEPSIEAAERSSKAIQAAAH